ncbi:MAG: cytoskeleton protein RodZ [Candidatus Azotimanducaceae bacterium]
MVLSFKEECWVEIEDSEHGRVYSDLNRAGDVLTVYGTTPFKVLLGKATGVEMIYNGRPFDLASYVGSDNTAKLTVAD